MLLCLLCALPLFPYFPSQNLVLGDGVYATWTAYLPPCWFWGWAEHFLGSGHADLSLRAEVGLASAWAAASLTYLVSYLQYGRYALESVKRARARWFDAVAAIAGVFRLPNSRAVCEFTLWTLARCRRQKMALMLIGGIGVALVVESSLYIALHPERNALRAARTLQTAVFTAPLTLSFFAMLGLRRAFRMPEELRANWLFRFLETQSHEEQLRAVLMCFLFIAAAPFWLFCAPFEIFLFGPKAAAVLAPQGLMMFTLAVYLLREWRAIPFTVAQNPGRGHFIHSAAVHIIELTAYSGIGSAWIWAGLRSPGWFLSLIGANICVLLVLRGLGGDDRELPFEFAERVSEPVEALRIAVD